MPPTVAHTFTLFLGQRCGSETETPVKNVMEVDMLFSLCVARYLWLECVVDLQTRTPCDGNPGTVQIVGRTFRDSADRFVKRVLCRGHLEQSFHCAYADEARHTCAWHQQVSWTWALLLQEDFSINVA